MSAAVSQLFEAAQSKVLCYSHRRTPCSPQGTLTRPPPWAQRAQLTADNPREARRSEIAGTCAEWLCTSPDLQRQVCSVLRARLESEGDAAGPGRGAGGSGLLAPSSEPGASWPRAPSLAGRGTVGNVVPSRAQNGRPSGLPLKARGLGKPFLHFHKACPSQPLSVTVLPRLTHWTSCLNT